MGIGVIGYTRPEPTAGAPLGGSAVDSAALLGGINKVSGVIGNLSLKTSLSSGKAFVKVGTFYDRIIVGQDVDAYVSQNLPVTAPSDVAIMPPDPIINQSGTDAYLRRYIRLIHAHGFVWGIPNNNTNQIWRGTTIENMTLNYTAVTGLDQLSAGPSNVVIATISGSWGNEGYVYTTNNGTSWTQVSDYINYSEYTSGSSRTQSNIEYVASTGFYIVGGRITRSSLPFIAWTTNIASNNWTNGYLASEPRHMDWEINTIVANGNKFLAMPYFGNFYLFSTTGNPDNTQAYNSFNTQSRLVGAVTTQNSTYPFLLAGYEGQNGNRPAIHEVGTSSLNHNFISGITSSLAIFWSGRDNTTNLLIKENRNPTYNTMGEISGFGKTINNKVILSYRQVFVSTTASTFPPTDFAVVLDIDGVTTGSFNSLSSSRQQFFAGVRQQFPTYEPRLVFDDNKYYIYDSSNSYAKVINNLSDVWDASFRRSGTSNLFTYALFSDASKVIQ